MTHESIDLSRIAVNAKRKYKTVIGIMIVCVAAAGITALSLPKRYKSRTVLTIYTRYFQNPLVRDFLPEVTDSNELRSQRESLIRLALSNEFLDALGERHRIYQYGADDLRRSGERQDLFARFEINALNQSTYQIAFASGSPQEAYQITQEALDQITTTLATERRRTITSLRDSIKAQIESLGLSIQKFGAPLPATDVSTLRKELNRVEGQIATLKTIYSDRHPAVTKLQARARMISDTIREQSGQTGMPIDAAGTVAGAGASLTQLSGDEPKEAKQELFQDLFKKFNYLSVAAQMEEPKKSSGFGIIEYPTPSARAFFPNKFHFLAWGLMTGVLLSALLLMQAPVAEASGLTFPLPHPAPPRVPVPPPFRHAPAAIPAPVINVRRARKSRKVLQPEPVVMMEAKPRRKTQTMAATDVRP